VGSGQGRLLLSGSSGQCPRSQAGWEEKGLTGQTAAIPSGLASPGAPGLANLPGAPMSEIERWLPDEWKRRNPKSPA